MLTKENKNASDELYMGYLGAQTLKNIILRISYVTCKLYQ